MFNRKNNQKIAILGIYVENKNFYEKFLNLEKSKVMIVRQKNLIDQKKLQEYKKV